MSETENNQPNEKVEQGVDDKVNNKSELSLHQTSAPSLSSNDFSEVSNAVAHLKEIKQLAEVFIKGGLCPIKNENDFTIAVITGKQLNLPFTTSINNIFPVNGKPGMSAHLMRALLLQNGISFNKDNDFEEIFVYYEGVKDAEGNLVAKKIKVGDKEVPVPRGTDFLSNIDQTKYIVGNQAKNRGTKYTFTRKLKQIDGSYKDIKVVSKFTMVDAVTAQLADGVNWTKYPQRMCDARSFTAGAREIASDILFGMMSLSELADANNVPYTITDSLEEEIIQDAVIVEK